MCCTGAAPVPLTGMDAGEPVALLVMEMLLLAAPLVAGANCTVNVVLWEGDRVTAEPPVSENVAPLKFTLEIATFALPVLATVTLRDAVLPTVTFPKLTFEGLTERVYAAATPVPLRATVVGVLAASLPSTTLPVEAAAVVGLNCTLKEVDCPGFKVTGKFRPTALKPAPVTLALAIFTLLLPEFVSCTGCVFVTPETTLPKLMLPGETASCDAGADVVLVPDKLTVVAPPCELTSAMFPLLVPAAVGLNFTFKVTASPGTISSGAATPLAEKPVPVRLICESVTLAVPSFRNVALADAELPALMLLKFNSAGVAVSFPMGTAVPSPFRFTTVVGMSASSLEIATLPK